MPEGQKLLLIAGKVGNLKNGELVGGLEAQYSQSLANVISINESEGGKKADPAKITVFFTEGPQDWKAI